MASLFVYWQMLPATARSWLARLGLIGAVLVLAFSSHQIDKRAAVREAHRAGVDQCEAAHREAVEILNGELDRLQSATHMAAVDRAIAMQALSDMERTLADERAQDYRDNGDRGYISDDGMRRIYSIP